MKPVYLCAPAYAHGHLLPITSIPEVQSDQDLCATLQAVGLETYAQHDGPIEELLVKAIQETLKRASLEAGQIDALVYASSLYSQGPQHDTTYPSRLMGCVARAAGLDRAIPYGISFTQCVNAVAGLEMARGLVGAGMHHVLVLAGDAMRGTFSRVVEPGISVTSDVAACLLVSNAARGSLSLEMGSVRHAVDWALLDVKSHEDFGEYVKRTVAGMGRALQALMSADALKAADYAQLLTNTINHSVVRIFSRASGIGADRIFRGNVNRLAHCDAADVIVNFSDWSSSHHGARAGDRVIMAANGPFAWGAVSASVC